MKLISKNFSTSASVVHESYVKCLEEWPNTTDERTFIVGVQFEETATDEVHFTQVLSKRQVNIKSHDLRDGTRRCPPGPPVALTSDLWV